MEEKRGTFIIYFNLFLWREGGGGRVEPHPITLRRNLSQCTTVLLYGWAYPPFSSLWDRPPILFWDWIRVNMDNKLLWRAQPILPHDPLPQGKCPQARRDKWNFCQFSLFTIWTIFLFFQIMRGTLSRKYEGGPLYPPPPPVNTRMWISYTYPWRNCYWCSHTPCRY